MSDMNNELIDYIPPEFLNYSIEYLENRCIDKLTFDTRSLRVVSHRDGELAYTSAHLFTKPNSCATPSIAINLNYSCLSHKTHFCFQLLYTGESQKLRSIYREFKLYAWHPCLLLNLFFSSKIMMNVYIKVLSAIWSNLRIKPLEKNDLIEYFSIFSCYNGYAACRNLFKESS